MSNVIEDGEEIALDLNRLDTLARFVASTGSRRSLLGLLAALPAAGALLTGHDRDDASAKERRRRRKQRHRRRKNPGARKHNGNRPCKPDSLAQTCAGRCGSVTNNCRKDVNCGSCACDPPCGACFTCGADGQCAACADCCDSDGACQTGTSNAACGGSGTCAVCSGTTPLCVGQACVACSAANLCPSGLYCAGDGSCVAECPACQTVESGLCVADASQDGACCNGASNGTWCQAGACEAVPANGSFAQCQSYCEGGGFTGVIQICGASVQCPACDTCGCTGFACTGTGPVGFGLYCRVDGDTGMCSSYSDCQENEVCCGGFCRVLCVS